MSTLDAGLLLHKAVRSGQQAFDPLPTTAAFAGEFAR
jgi:hypothetical protein